jgi:hypothetical protein
MSRPAVTLTEAQGRALDELVSLHGADSRKLALVVGGSIAAGKARPDSDIDLYLVVTDEEFERVHREEGCFYGSWDPRRFSGVEIDGKVVGKRFLQEAAIRGNEPTRAFFAGAYAEFSHDPDIDELLPLIAAYPEAERERKLRAFWAFTKHYRWVGVQAFELGNDYAARRCALELVFFASRLALAHNRVLYPCHKSLTAAVETCADLPVGFVAASRELLAAPTPAALVALYDLVAAHFAAYDYPDQERIGFILDQEWSWFSGLQPAADS